MRRAIIFAITLSMALLASTPVSVCALISSQIAECKTSKGMCDGMDMHMDGQDDVSRLSLSCQTTTACCIVSQTPRPESQCRLDETLDGTPRIGTTADVDFLSVLTESIPVFKWQDLSPPAIQSLLCTFLI